jgi:hypothetical protein
MWGGRGGEKGWGGRIEPEISDHKIKIGVGLPRSLSLLSLSLAFFKCGVLSPRPRSVVCATPRRASPSARPTPTSYGAGLDSVSATRQGGNEVITPPSCGSEARIGAGGKG